MSREGSARLFVAADPPAAVAGQLAAWARAVAAGGGRRREGQLRLLGEESLHLTLLFLGSRPVEEIAELTDALVIAGEEGRECELALGAPLWLPPRHPRALAVEVHDPTGELARLQRLLATHLGDGERRASRFRPHITVARCRSDARPQRALQAITPQVAFTASEVVLYRSWLDPAGARYEPLASVPLVRQAP